MRDTLLMMDSKMGSSLLFTARGWRLMAPKEDNININHTCILWISISSGFAAKYMLHSESNLDLNTFSIVLMIIGL